MRGAPAWRRRRSVTHPSSVSALRADPPSPPGGEGIGRLPLPQPRALHGDPLQRLSPALALAA
ncbi:MAG: hypothetical protein E5W88_01990 [Mesorhizobium sp.]|nr:MAG: hypothetical protein E5W88_01990 [Mesorhizobium sp.]